jgi:hypothetical protein
MTAMKSLMLAAAFVSWTVLVQPTHAVADTVTGELAVLNGSKTQFRVVGHGGTFTAPAGTPLERLDGRNVQVELSSSGKVSAIHEVPVPVNPVEHGFQTVRGELVVVDPVNRRFTIAGDNQTYTAPPPIDVAAYAGKLVEFKIDESGRVTEFRAVGASPYGYAPPYPAPASGPQSGTYNSYGTAPNTYGAAPSNPPPAAATTCTYAGQPYSAGAAICQAGSQYRCNLGQWQNLGTPCDADAKQLNVPVGEPRSCVVGGATVANGSGICRDGSTLRCEDGTWINTQVACR